MTYKEFLKKKDELDLSFSQFANIIGYTPDAIKKWKHKEKVPKWVGIIVSYIEISNKIKENTI